MTDHQPNIHDHEWLVEDGFVPDVNGLGAVMLPVLFREGFLSRGYSAGAIAEADLYIAKNPDHFWVKGDVSNEAHITILYGLITPAYEQGDVIERLLAGWTPPSFLPIVGYEAFPSPFEDEDYICLVAIISDREDGVVKSARGLLQYLPHVDTFQEYKMHATIAYVNAEVADTWLEYLNSWVGEEVEVPDVPLDLGSKK